MSSYLAQNPFGQIKPPPGVEKHGATPSGLINLLNLGLKLLVVFAGIYAVINIIFAGYQFMSAGGDPKNIEKAWGRIWQSLIGLLLVAGSFLIAAIFGQLLFGRADAILNPSIFVPNP